MRPVRSAGSRRRTFRAGGFRRRPSCPCLSGPGPSGLDLPGPWESNRPAPASAPGNAPRSTLPTCRRKGPGRQTAGVDASLAREETVRRPTSSASSCVWESPSWIRRAVQPSPARLLRPRVPRLARRDAAPPVSRLRRRVFFSLFVGASCVFASSRCGWASVRSFSRWSGVGLGGRWTCLGNRAFSLPLLAQSLVRVGRCRLLGRTGVARARDAAAAVCRSSDVRSWPRWKVWDASACEVPPAWAKRAERGWRKNDPFRGWPAALKPVRRPRAGEGTVAGGGANAGRLAFGCAGGGVLFALCVWLSASASGVVVFFFPRRRGAFFLASDLEPSSSRDLSPISGRLRCGLVRRIARWGRFLLPPPPRPLPRGGRRGSILAGRRVACLGRLGCALIC